MFNLNHIDETRFEEFCFDLLKHLDFVNISWRKGTGLTASPSDQGRDIEAELIRKDVDGSVRNEKWFVECKHYTKGVPPDKIQGALAWANSKRPDVLLVIASNFLSNSTKNYLDDYKKENRPPYHLKIWELKDIEHLTTGLQDLRAKYELPTEIPYLNILNKYHIAYIASLQINSAEFLIEVMDALNAAHRDRAFEMLYHEVVRPKYRQPASGKETLAELKIDQDDYPAFREKILISAESQSPGYIQQIISFGLAYLFQFANTTAIPEFIKRNEDIAEEFEARSRNPGVSDEKRSRFMKMAALPRKLASEMPQRTARYYETYQYICENMIKKLLNEKMYPPKD
jgi:hypothetical protein